MEPGDAAIVCDGLTKRFGELIAVDRLSMRVDFGEVFGFLGPNGSGKTTTIRMLCGIITPSEGAGSVLGFNIATQGEEIKQRVGYMSQRFALYEDLTVVENLEFYAEVYQYPRGRLRERLRELISMADLTGRERSLAAHLSGGWKQRLALACAIVHQPPLLFLDEPTAGVDPVSRRRFWTMIYSLAGQGITIFLTTHYLDEAEHANRVGMMHAGRLIALDTPAILRQRGLRGSLFELQCEPVMAALESLPKVSGVREVTLYGTMLHVVTDLDWDAEKLTTRSAETGLQVSSVRRIAASLEDVFVSLIRPERSAEGEE